MRKLAAVRLLDRDRRSVVSGHHHRSGCLLNCILRGDCEIEELQTEEGQQVGPFALERTVHQHARDRDEAEVHKPGHVHMLWRIGDLVINHFNLVTHWTYGSSGRVPCRSVEVRFCSRVSAVPDGPPARTLHPILEIRAVR